MLIVYNKIMSVSIILFNMDFYSQIRYSVKVLGQLSLYDNNCVHGKGRWEMRLKAQRDGKYS